MNNQIFSKYDQFYNQAPARADSYSLFPAFIQGEKDIKKQHGFILDAVMLTSQGQARHFLEAIVYYVGAELEVKKAKNLLNREKQDLDLSES